MQYYVIYKDNAGEWRWRLNDEGEIIATSHDGHMFKSICESEIEKVKKSHDAPVIDG